ADLMRPRGPDADGGTARPAADPRACCRYQRPRDPTQYRWTYPPWPAPRRRTRGHREISRRARCNAVSRPRDDPAVAASHTYLGQGQAEGGSGIHDRERGAHKEEKTH